jgi:hypothetical protein
MLISLIYLVVLWVPFQQGKSTTGWGTTLSVDTANSDMLITIEGF